MYVFYPSLVFFVEETSFIWYLNRKKITLPKAEILVLGDSQFLSGVTSKLISQMENIPEENILFKVRPSEQPEGMLDQYLHLRSDLPNLKIIYLNLSPISISKNSVTDAHRELYFGFSPFAFHQLTESTLRDFYFRDSKDIFWKFIIECFPFFGLNQNFSSLFRMIEEKEGVTFQKKMTLQLMKARWDQNKYLDTYFQENSHWTWNNFGIEKELVGEEVPPKGSSLAFKKERDPSLKAIKRLVEIAKQSKIKIVCFDLPFSPGLESDIKNFQVRDRLDNEIYGFGFSRIIKVPHDALNLPKYFVDFTHLNAMGRDALKSYLLKIN